MVATADLKTWAIQGEDSPAHAARLLASAILNEGVVDLASNSFKVAQDTGANMQIKVGSGTLGDLAAVSGESSGQGLYVCEHQDATVTLTVAAADANNDRIDRVILRVYDDEADSSGNSYADIEVIQGTPGAVPVAPDLPDGAISLATIEVDEDVTAIVTADITDLRVSASTGGAAPGGQIGYAQVIANQATITGTEADLTGLTSTVTVPAGRRIKITAGVRLAGTTTSNVATLRIKESTTVLQTSEFNIGSRTALDQGHVAVVVLTPTAAAHTYKLSLQMSIGTGSVSLGASATAPAFILVEDLGPA